MLMAADILIHNAEIVPVGKDQKQHVEFARDTAEKFNRIFCNTQSEGDTAGLFKLPEAYIVSDVETVPGVDGQKMSKSYNNHIPLFSTDEEIHKLVMSIVTDSGQPADSSDKMAGVPVHVFNIHRLLIGDMDLISKGKEYLKSEEHLIEFYKSTVGKYKPLKDALVSDLIEFITPLRKRREEIAKDPDMVRNMLAKNGALMREKVHHLMYEVRKKVGLVV